MPVSAVIMAVDEQKLRISLHQRLEAALGTDEAAFLMDYLPRRDLDAAITDLKSSLLM
jgi:hypothetical protein